MPLTLSPTQIAFNARGDGAFHRPFAEQVAFLRDKLDLPTEHWDDILKGAHDRAFVVAGAMKADLLADFHAAVLKTATEGKSLQWFKKEFEAIVAKNGWQGWTGEDTPQGRDWRARVIYRTNLTTSHAAGRYAQLTDPELLQTRPYWKYVHSDTVQHPRPLHQAWGRQPVVLRHDDPWWQTHYPPNGWGCRCRIVAVRPEEYPGDPAPDDGTWTKTDRNGDPHVIPKGIDYGWDYAPGASRAEELRQLVADKTAKLPGPIGQAFNSQMQTILNKYQAPPSWSLINGGSATLDEMKRLGEERLNDLLDTVLPDHVASSVAGWTPTPGATLREAMAKNMALPDTVMQWLRETTLQRAGQVRAMGGVKPALYQKSGIGVQLMNRVARKLPDEWVRHANQYPVHVAVSKGRGFFSTGHWIPAKNELRRFIKTSSGSTAEHEFMHHIQYADPNLDALFADEHRRRTLNDAVVQLYPGVKGLGGEKGKPDNYVDVYQGREYSGKPLEVITMAYQAMLGGDKRADGYLHGTLYYDQDMLKLILGTLFHYSP